MLGLLLNRDRSSKDSAASTEAGKLSVRVLHSSEEASAAQFEIDHIVPRSLGGADHPENLALACQRCNAYRYNFTSGIDPHTQKVVALFNPRRSSWSNHFRWTADGLTIVGITPTGRATCDRLDLNDARHNQGWILKVPLS